MEYVQKECERCGLKTTSYKFLEVKNKTNNNYRKKYYCHGPNTNDCYEKERPWTIGDIFGIIFAPIRLVVGIVKFIIRLPSHLINAFKSIISFVKKVLSILLIPFKIIMYPFILLYRHNKKIRNAMVYIFGVIVFIFMKILSVLKFVGIKVFDQDGDGKVDLNDFAIAKKKVQDFFDRAKKDNNSSKILDPIEEKTLKNENIIEEIESTNKEE
tara:strand:+ start:104 stop:742 length:639 start_codon:yes stop_codon:yes gene_type:complete